MSDSPNEPAQSAAASKRRLESTSSSDYTPMMQCDPAARSSPSPKPSRVLETNTRSSKKRRKREAKLVDGNRNALGFTKIRTLLAIEDTETFSTELNRVKESFLRQFNTTKKHGIDHMIHIGDCLERIKDLPEKESWWASIEPLIVDFVSLHIVPHMIPQRNIPDATLKNFCTHPKIDEYFKQMGITESPPVNQAPMDVDVLDRATHSNSNECKNTIPTNFRQFSIFPTESDILCGDTIHENIVRGKYDNIDHYLEVQFRLLREDFVRPLRNGINEYRAVKSKAAKTGTAPNFRINDLNVYQNVRINGSKMLHSERVHFCRFDSKPFENVRWQHNKRMMNGSLVCLSADDFGTFIFATVAGYRNPDKLARGEFQIRIEAESSSTPEITPNIDFVMIESRVYFEAYRHNLKVLQEFDPENFPLEKYIVSVDKDISPPSYLTNNSAYLISNGLPDTDPNAKKSLVKVMHQQEWPPREDFNLNESQYYAFRAALTKQMVVIQGPPGTGKTFIGLRIVEVLLANTQQWPILIVCYTNHALDQFLEGILKFCKNDGDLIRIGKSQSEALAKCNMSTIKQNMIRKKRVAMSSPQSRIDSQICQRTLILLENDIYDLEKKTKNMLDTILGDELAEAIQAINSNHYTQLSRLNLKEAIFSWLGCLVPPGHVEVADELQQVQTNREAVEEHISEEIKKPQTMSEEQAKAVTDINGLLRDDRWNLYRLWLKLYAQKHENRINEKREEYRIESLRFDEMQKQQDIEIVKNSRIVGLTTTGAAKYRHIIDGTKPKITIVEEAAQVLEAHIVTSLCHETDHLILIGDHLQLQPNPAVYELSKKFNLNISLFERLIKNELQYYQLKEQRRMRPCISSLVRGTIYKELKDCPSVMEYENIKGITKNMFFVRHSQNEKSMQETRSHFNAFEADFIVELGRYIVLQGYETKQVTILTTYSGQLHQIRELMKKYAILDGVRSTSIDNYQGEECDIILLSFVRSNEEGNIGFLKDSHRVNVALSRARKGLYCIGNFDFLAEANSIWRSLIDNLSAQQAIGTELEIFCQNHPTQKTKVSSKKDFAASLEGGCSLPCGYRLLCGHVCEKTCHIVDKEHLDRYNDCHKSCDKLMPNCLRSQHRCRRKCHFGDECGPCLNIVEKIRPGCEHKIQVKCSVDPSSATCMVGCQKIRACRHTCNNVCSVDCESTPCCESVLAYSPCGHQVTVPSSDSRDTSKLFDACPEPCNTELKCGHLCKGSCGRCKVGRLHISCTEKCTQTLVCGHPCTDFCSIDCPPCKEKCENSCTHSTCPLRCGDPCTPCMEKCKWRCEHLQCTNLCSEPCNRDMCENPNRGLLPSCGHSSIGVCGETMPKLCRVCNEDKVKTIFFGDEDEEGARFIELADCKHIIEVNALLRWISEPKSNSDENVKNYVQMKTCPICKTVIRKTKSLNKFIQASLCDIQKVKLKTCGSPTTNAESERILLEKVREVINYRKFATDPFGLKPIYNKISDELKHKVNNVQTNARSKPHSLQKLTELENQFHLVQRIAKIGDAFSESRKLNQNVSIDTIEQFSHRLRMAIAFIHQFKNCEQQRGDIANEISFLHLMSDVIVQSSGKPSNAEGQQSLDDAFKMANGHGAVTQTIRNEFKEAASAALKKFSRIGISLEEKEMVLAAMGLSRGHWFRCPKGHVYAIGDCGGATHESVCSECGSLIGGEQHRLRDDNALATEMDNATAPAWPQ